VLSLGPGESATVDAGVAHDWWNSSTTEEAHVLVEIDRAADADHIDPNRFELLVGMLFGLANDGTVDAKGRPYPLQAAVIAREFSDVVVFTSPPPVVQRFLIGLLVPIATLLGYRAIHADYCRPHRHILPDPEILKAAGLPVQ
jgi:hypothetical protein